MTDIVDIDAFVTLARDVVKSDGDDDNVLTQNAKSSVGVAEGFCRRKLYWTQAELDAAKATFETLVTNAENAWQTAQDTYPVICDGSNPTQDRINARMLDAAWNSYVASMNEAMKINDGIVIDDAILAALLLITGHLYKNRQEVVAGPAAAAVQVPMGAQRILEPKMAV